MEIRLERTPGVATQRVVSTDGEFIVTTEYPVLKSTLTIRVGKWTKTWSWE